MTPQPAPLSLVIGLGAAAVLAAGLAAGPGVVAGGLVGGLAAFGLLAKWPPAPPLVLLLAAYLSLFPDGWPGGEWLSDGGVAAGPKLLPLLAAAAAVVYAAAHYRQLSAADHDEESPVWPMALFGGAAAAVVGGRLLLAAAVLFRPDYARGPLRFIRATDDDPWRVVFARFLMLAAVAGVGAVAAGLGLWLARLNRLSAAEARQLLLDTRWLEARRELARLETWRAARLRPRSESRVRRPGRALWYGVGLGLFVVTFFIVLRVLRN